MKGLVFISKLSCPCDSLNFHVLFAKVFVPIWHFMNNNNLLMSVNKLKMVCCDWLFLLLFSNRNFKASQVILGELTHFDVLWGSCTPKKLTAVVREVLSFYHSPEFTIYLLLFCHVDSHLFYPFASQHFLCLSCQCLESVIFQPLSTKGDSILPHIWRTTQQIIQKLSCFGRGCFGLAIVWSIL